MEKKNFTVCGMFYEVKHRMLVKAVMKANDWNEDEYELK